MAWSAAPSSFDAPRNPYGLPMGNADDDGSTVLSPEELARIGKLVALGELTPGVAHELNNPLFAILGLVDFLLAEAEPGSRAHRRLTVVHETAWEMREIVRALIDFAREPGEGSAPFDLAESVRATLALVRRTTSAKDVELVERLSAEPLTVRGSRNQIRQCLLHLLANAGTALPRGGTVTVELTGGAGWATLALSDSGPGIPDELRTEVFEPFFTTRKGGSGLGLAACRAIAESHGGTLKLGPSGGGAVFVLRLPVSTEAGAR
jgi:signal transduction histidine kinase